MTNYISESQKSLEASLAAQLALRSEYELPRARQDQTRIAGLHQAINHGMKSAEVCALIAIAQQLQALGEVPEPFELHAAQALRVVSEDDQ